MGPSLGQRQTQTEGKLGWPRQVPWRGAGGWVQALRAGRPLSLPPVAWVLLEGIRFYRNQLSPASLGHSGPYCQVLLVVCPSKGQALESSERAGGSPSTSPQASKQIIVLKPHCLACL